ncbi:hypothetical protein DVH24_023735 [Malus domestica]|uniref:Uncharacterized protein n=1 Tax=Malus domestica TaxID=3750 RepID=A0A498I7I0_MALDO|nr:hypothetical protein DVH24_023735 [Malus domestica]
MMGQVVDAGAFNLDGVTISFAEAMGLKRRIQVCSVQGPPKGDDKRETPSLLLRRFKEIGRFLGRLELSLRWNHICQGGKFVADALAHLGLSVETPHIWDHGLPSIALNAFSFDSIRNGCSRESCFISKLHPV